MELSSSTLQSRPDKIQPAVATPNIQQRLEALAMTGVTFQTLSLTDTFTVNNVEERILTKSSEVSGSWIINPNWIDSDLDNEAIAAELAQMDLSNHDFEIPVSFSAETPSLAMIDRRTYVTSPFTVTYDATTCESDGDARAEIEVMRTEVQARTISNGDGNWSSVELPSRVEGFGCCSQEEYALYLASSAAAYDVATLRELAADGLFKGEAYLLKSRTSSDGDRRLNPIAMRPNDFYDYGEYNDGIELYGSSGTATLRAVTKLYGELSQNAQLRTQYGFWMEVFPYGN
jgi:hypothetical protein